MKDKNSTLDKLLSEAIDGKIMGVRIGDHIQTISERWGEPDAVGHVGRFIIYHPVEFSLGDDDTVQLIYVEVPDDVVLKCEYIKDLSSCSISADPEIVTATIGCARLCIDRHSMRVLSFSN
ncbi:MAG: hypothetical protein HKM93_09030 [Desulfobacteraceae bacterium]|nr:hypothetical protein [Desulfobacteraceae bacterium]